MKKRLTVLFCVNKTDSHKLKSLCIGKSHQPRCCHHVNMKSLPFVYANSSANTLLSVSDINFPTEWGLHWSALFICSEDSQLDLAQVLQPLTSAVCGENTVVVVNCCGLPKWAYGGHSSASTSLSRVFAGKEAVNEGGPKRQFFRWGSTYSLVCVYVMYMIHDEDGVIYQSWNWSSAHSIQLMH